MNKFLIGGLLLVLSLAACGHSVYKVANTDPDELRAELDDSVPTAAVRFTEGESTEFEVTEAGTYMLLIGESRDGRYAREDFVFVDAGGDRTELSANFGELTVTMNNEALALIGNATLTAGTWQVEHPALEAGVDNLVVSRFEIPAFAMEMLAGFGLGALFALAGVVFLILAFVDRGQQKKAARAETFYDD